MNWIKQGLIFCADKNFPWMQTHAAIPLVQKIEDNRVSVFFSTRNKNNQSSIGELVFELDTLTVLYLGDKPVLENHSIGYFDSDGIMGSELMHIGKSLYLYYIGWNLGRNIPFRNSIGVAELIDGQFKRKFNGPILDRSIHDPCFVASCTVIKKEDYFLMFYTSCDKWENSGLSIRHYYNIKVASSIDGLNWYRDGKIAIDFKDNKEYAISVPRVLFENGIYKMWYTHRGSSENRSYRIGYAESVDGLSWIRKDHLMNFEPSLIGWDSEMLCYPYLFNHSGKTYMLYNGNDYGKSGFGLAVLERENNF